MQLVFINIPATSSHIFEKNFNGKIKSNFNIRSVGHSWLYPTQIKGWRDWDFPNQEWGVYRDVDVYSLNQKDRVVTIVKNPFHLLFDYYNTNWAWCKDYTNTKSFENFIDSYLNTDIKFHVPAFQKSLFSQLKDKSGNWILKRDSIVMRFERLDEDIEIFSNLVDIDLSETIGTLNSLDWKTAYREDQIEKLNKLWKDDLEYFGYSFDGSFQKNNKIEVKKPKIALCLSGLIRDIDYTKEFWISLIDKYDIDVYGSFWDDENQSTNDTIQNLKTIFNFKEVEFERYSNFKKSTLDLITPYITPPNTLLSELIDYAKEFHTLSMWYKVWRANMLSKSLDIKYDIIIRGRTDTIMNNDLKIELNNYLNIPSGIIETDNWENSHGLCDIFAFGKPELMDYYSSMYLNLLEYVNQGHYMIPPENLLRVHMSRVDVDINFLICGLVITRFSKGIKNEIYDRNPKSEDFILKSTFRPSQPNKDINWTSSIRNNLKF